MNSPVCVLVSIESDLTPRLCFSSFTCTTLSRRPCSSHTRQQIQVRELIYHHLVVSDQMFSIAVNKMSVLYICFAASSHTVLFRQNLEM